MGPLTIPPLTDVSPVVKVEEREDEFRFTIGYTEQVIRTMVSRINENLAEELIKRLAEQRGYIKPVRCRDCDHFDGVGMCKRNMYTSTEYDLSGDSHEVIEGLVFVDPEGYCAWPKPREIACRKADEETATTDQTKPLSLADEAEKYGLVGGRR